MNPALLLPGVGLLVVAIIGGGVDTLGVRIPQLLKTWQRLALLLPAGLLIVLGAVDPGDDSSSLAADHPACGLSGWVYLKANNRPLSQAEVYFDGIDDQPGARRATTAPDGGYDLDCRGVDADLFPLHVKLSHEDWCGPLATDIKIESTDLGVRRSAVSLYVSPPIKVRDVCMPGLVEHTLVQRPEV